MSETSGFMNVTGVGLWLSETSGFVNVIRVGLWLYEQEVLQM